MFDDLNFNPLLEGGQELEEWKSKFESIWPISRPCCCLGKDKIAVTRCDISKIKQPNIVEDPELDTLTWVDCIQIFEQIPSVVINDEAFSVPIRVTRIRHDLSFKRCKYNNRTRDEIRTSNRTNLTA